MPPTILDIATHAATSKSTVSRYLNGGSVSKKAAEAIEHAIVALGYTPNVNARRLVSHKSHTIGVVLDDISDHIYGALLSGIQTAAHRLGYICTFFSRKPTHAAESDYLDLFTSRQVDGLLFATFRVRDAAEVALLAQSRQPIVLIGEHTGVLHMPSVDVDNVSGTLEEITYLIGHGRRRIAYLAGPKAMSASQSRLRGYEKALELHGIPVEEALIEHTGWSVEEGFEAARRLLQRTDFDALVGSNAYCTYGAVRALKDAGRHIPIDVAVASFDDDVLTAFTRPSLTTLQQPLARIGQIAVEQLVSRMEGGNDMMSTTYVQPKLILRESTDFQADTTQGGVVSC